MAGKTWKSHGIDQVFVKVVRIKLILFELLGYFCILVSVYYSKQYKKKIYIYR